MVTQYRTISCCFKKLLKPFCWRAICREVETMTAAIHHIKIEMCMFVSFHFIRCLQAQQQLQLPGSDTELLTFLRRAYSTVSNPRGTAQPVNWHADEGPWQHAAAGSCAAYLAARPEQCPLADRWGHTKQVRLPPSPSPAFLEVTTTAVTAAGSA